MTSSYQKFSAYELCSFPYTHNILALNKRKEKKDKFVDSYNNI